jgi:hypothetical protein
VTRPAFTFPAGVPRAARDIIGAGFARRLRGAAAVVLRTCYLLCGVLMGIAVAGMSCFAFQLRMEAPDERRVFQVIDGFLGALAAVAFLLYRVGTDSPEHPRSERWTWIGFLLVGLITAGSLQLWHEGVAHVRWAQVRPPAQPPAPN